VSTLPTPCVNLGERHEGVLTLLARTEGGIAYGRIPASDLSCSGRGRSFSLALDIPFFRPLPPCRTPAESDVISNFACGHLKPRQPQNNTQAATRYIHAHKGV